MFGGASPLTITYISQKSVHDVTLWLLRLLKLSQVCCFLNCFEHQSELSTITLIPLFTFHFPCIPDLSNNFLALWTVSDNLEIVAEEN